MLFHLHTIILKIWQRRLDNIVANEMENIFEEIDEEPDYISTYDIASNPNDFNVATLKSYIENDAISIPSFQRNYVWEIKRASRFIESLILGLPIPQLFFYEEKRNRYLVVDGQQRLMTIYYYLLGKFPKLDMRNRVREIFDKKGFIPSEELSNEEIFQDFKLNLPSSESGQRNPLHGLAYKDLDEQQTVLDLRTIRCVMVRQTSPKDDDSSVYEIFNRLNTGGTNLRPQEIRSCMYKSSFYEMLSKINRNEKWRRFFGKSEPDLHLRDIEILLRAFAMLENGKKYSTTMSRFLNLYSKQQKGISKERVYYLNTLFDNFLDASSFLNNASFINDRSNGKFNVNLFESVFVMSVINAYRSDSTDIQKLEQAQVDQLKNNEDFITASIAQTTNTSNVRKRLECAAQVFNVEW